jgi:flagellar biosynthesis/type III secretory pathway protein FliH
MYEGIPPRGSSDGAEFAPILSDAGRILQFVRHQTESLQRRAYSEGRAAGFARAQVESAAHVLIAQRKARSFVEDSEQHIIELALSIVARVAAKLDEASVVAALLADALNTSVAEHELRVSVRHVAVTAVRTMLARWQQAHPKAVVQVLIDPQLQPFVCVIESEKGRVELSLRGKLEEIRAELNRRAAG